MKKISFSIFALLMLWFCAPKVLAQGELTFDEAYALYVEEDSTLTFYYDSGRSSRVGITWSLNAQGQAPLWNAARSGITKVIFDFSFREAKPYTTEEWFSQDETNPKLREIVGMQYLNTSKTVCMANMFHGCRCLKEIDLSNPNFHTENVTVMSGMFSDCSSLTSLDLSTFDTSKVTQMSTMFYGCTNLKELNLSSFDVRNVDTMNGMFLGCASLENLDLSGFHTESLTLTERMFEGCSSLKNLDISNFNVEGVGRFSSMFRDCSSLENLDISGFKTNRAYMMSYMFSGCNNLKTIDLSGFITGGVQSLAGLFKDCHSLQVLDLSTFYTHGASYMSEMFMNCYNLKTIFCGDDWGTDNLGSGGQYSSAGMFGNCFALVGEKGTTYDPSFTNSYYAHVDGGVSNPGYLTYKSNEPTNVQSVRTDYNVDDISFSVCGIKMNGSIPGVNIVRMKDGTIRKYVKNK